MKNMNKYMQFLIVTLFLAITTSCNTDDDTVYVNPNLINSDIGLSYTDLTTYSFLGDIIPVAPTFNIETSVYSFIILKVTTTDGKEVTNKDKFAIDTKTGAVKIDNKTGILKAGETYTFDIGINNINGVLKNEDVLNITINNIPLDYTIDVADVSVGFLDEVDIATVTYTDTSAAGIIDASSIEYKLTDAPNGFSINKTTGVISRTTAASTGVYLLSVSIQTNVGQVLFSDILTVTVGESPTLVYTQTSNTNALTNATLSPWTAYTTAMPTLAGMDDTGGYEVILPATLTAGSITANADGTLSIAADKNLPVGTYTIGVKVTNGAGVSVDFEDLFTITVESRWETTDYFNDTFNDGSTGTIDPGNTLYPDYAGYTLGDVSKWQKSFLTKAGAPDLEGLRVFNPGLADHYLVRSIDITGVKALRIFFGEVFGYNDAFITKYKRGLFAGESTADLDAGSFNVANWATVMQADDSKWPGSSNWQTRVSNSIDNVLVDLSNITGNDLKLAWYLGSNGSSQNGQYVIDYCRAEVSLAFPAEEN